MYVRYLLEVFSKFEDPRARFGHQGVALVTEAQPRLLTKHEVFNLLKADSGYLTYLESSLLPALRKQAGESR